MPFSGNWAVQFLLVRAQFTDSKMLHSNQEGMESKTQLRPPNRKSSVAPCSKIAGKPQGTVTANAVFLRESCASKPTLCKIKDGKNHVQSGHRTTDLQVGKLVVQGWFMLLS